MTGAAIDALVEIRAQTPQSLVRVTPRIRSTFFPGEEEQEATDGYLWFDAERRWEVMDLRLEGEYTQVVLLKDYLPTSEVSSGLGEPPRGEGIGVLDESITQKRFRILPEVKYDFDSRRGLRIGFEYLDVGYSGRRSELLDYVDYDNLWLGAGYTIKTSPTATVTLGVVGSLFEPDGGQVDSSNSYGLRLDWFNRLSEKSQVYARIGVDQTELKYLSGRTTDDTHFSGGAGVKWNFELTDVFLDANARIEPVPQGTVVQRSQVRFRVIRMLSPRFAVFGALRGIDDRAAGGQADYRDDQYFDGALGLEWRFTRSFALAGKYRYVWRDEEDSISSASSNAVSIGIIYEPKRGEGGPPISVAY